MRLHNKVSTDIRMSILGSPGSGRTTLCQHLNHHEHLRVSDGRSFRFLAREVTMNTAGLLDNSDIVFLTFSLNEELVEPVRQFQNLVRDYYLQQKQQFCIVGTKHDLLAPSSKYADYPSRLTTLVTLSTSIACAAVSILNGLGLDELCCSTVEQVHPVQPSIRSHLHRTLDRTRSWVFDVLAFLFALPVPRDINKDVPDSDSLPAIPDDDTVWEMIKAPESIAFNRRLAAYSNPIFNSAPTWKIASTLIAKRLGYFERSNNIFVRAHTNIPVPQPRYLHLKEALITDFIPGSMLLECWDSLSIFYQFRIACTLRRYVSQLRHVTSQRPGSIERGLVIGTLFAPQIWNGPFQDLESFRNWIAHVAHLGWIWKSDIHKNHPELGPSPPRPTFSSGCDWTLVFTHCDLSLGNIMLADDGLLWIIDWADSGFYPPWLESMGMRRYSTAPESWKRWHSFIVGSSFGFDVIWEYFSRYAANLGSILPREYYWPQPL